MESVKMVEIIKGVNRGIICPVVLEDKENFFVNVDLSSQGQPKSVYYQNDEVKFID